MSRDLSAALAPEQVAQVGARFLLAEFGARSALLVADADNHLRVQPGAGFEVDAAVAQWCFDKGEPAGRGTGTLPSSAALMLPLKAPMRLRGVLAVLPVQALLLSPEQRQLLDTCASLLAISLERIHYSEVAQQTTVQIESERLRNSLLAAISHDLRTPLAALVGLAETLALSKPPLAPPQIETARAIQASSLRMNVLLNNLLDMARLESGAVQLHREWQPLEEVLGSALAGSEQALDGRPVLVQLAKELPLLHLDAALFERVLANLLENTAKYTPPTTTLRITAEADAEAVRITLDDDGPGLPPGRDEAVFEKFERGSKEAATPGVGLGLAICRAIVQAHGGRIHGENRIEAGRVAGARFVITLPRGEPPQDDGSRLGASADNAPT
jgi:two-component system sensor histidine kinase KdpD